MILSWIRWFMGHVVVASTRVLPAVRAISQSAQKNFQRHLILQQLSWTINILSIDVEHLMIQVGGEMWDTSL